MVGANFKPFVVDVTIGKLDDSGVRAKVQVKKNGLAEYLFCSEVQTLTSVTKRRLLLVCELVPVSDELLASRPNRSDVG